MLLENITLGRVVEIYIDREGYRYRLTSKVEDVDEKRMCVTLIASNNKVFAFKPSDKIRIVYRDAEQMWEWDNVKAGMVKFDGVLVHYFDITNKGRSFNRRNAYRINLGDEILIGYYDVPESEAKSSEVPMEEDDENKEVYGYVKPEIIQGIVKDVSATGVGICTNTVFNKDDSFFFEIPSPYGGLKMKAQVVRSTELRATNNRYSIYYGCVLTQADKKLINYIYDIQREQLKKQKEKQIDEELRRKRFNERKE